MRPDNRALCAAVIGARAAHEQTPTLRTKRDLDAAVNAVVVANMGLVARLARPRARRAQHMTLEDLVHEGAFGIMRALETFDPARGLAFSTYASWWIRAAIDRAIDNQEHAIRLPSSVHEAQAKIAGSARAIRAREGREVTDEEAARSSGLRPGVALLAREAPVAMASIDVLIGESGVPLVELMASNEESPDAPVLRRERELAVHSLLSKLQARERHILLQRAEGRTLADIAGDCGVTRERVRQIEAEATVRLRELAEQTDLTKRIGA